MWRQVVSFKYIYFKHKRRLCNLRVLLSLSYIMSDVESIIIASQYWNPYVGHGPYILVYEWDDYPLSNLLDLC